MEDLLELQLKHEISAITKRIETIMENIKEFEPVENGALQQGVDRIKPNDNV